MPVTIDLAAILALPEGEKLEIAHAIYASLAEPPPGVRRELPEELKQELRRRLQEHRENPDDVIPWEEIKRDALARARRPA